jgi:hypothetical protein
VKRRSTRPEERIDRWQVRQPVRPIAARATTRAPESATPVIVAMALDEYEADIKTRGGDIGNVSQPRHNLPFSLNHLNAVYNAFDFSGALDFVKRAAGSAALKSAFPGLTLLQR